MKVLHTLKIGLALLFINLVAGAPMALADDAEDLTTMLNTFLAGVTRAEAHDRFWANDLIYTSSRGTRTGKAEIMQGFSGADKDATAAGPVFSAKDVQIQIYGETAIVAFRLVATPPESTDEIELQNYLNTGTFLKRNGIWKAVAWQATIIPGAEDE